MDNNNENNLTAPVKENIMTMLNNENVFKITIIIISCLNKLHIAGNSE